MLKDVREAHRSQAAEEYHLWYYETEVWNSVTFLGVPCLKSVCDLWNYQEILYNLRPSLLLEFGTYCGGSALYFAEILRPIVPTYRVLAIDRNAQRIDPRVLAHPHIEILNYNINAPHVWSRIGALREELPGPVFAILDSKHEKEHVLMELRLLRDVLAAGDYVVVEDTNLNGHPVCPNFGPGPMEAVREYEAEFPEDYEHDTRSESKFGFTFAPYGFLIRK